MGIIGYDDLADYILSHYPACARVVEVGIGQHPEVAQLLSGTFDLVCTDVISPGPARLKYAKDDIFKPDLSLYRDAALIYSMRPPVDLQPSLARVAAGVGADLIIRPFSSEKADLSHYYRRCQSVNHRSAYFYQYKRADIRAGH